VIKTLSFARTALAGMILSALPVLTLVSQPLTAPQIMTIDVPAKLIQTASGIKVSTAFNKLALSTLAGVSPMRMGDIVYIHIYQRGGVAQYAYAVSQNRPLQTDEETLTLRGVVTKTDEGAVYLDYLLSELPQSSPLTKALKAKALTGKLLGGGSPANLRIGVNQRAVAHIKSITFEGEVFNLR
jgi:hypothetical protein